MTSLHTIMLGFRAMVRLQFPWLVVVLALTTVVYAAVAAGIAIWADAAAIWANVHWVLQWVALAAGVGMASCLPMLVNLGLSRRTIVRSATAALVVLSVGMAVWVQLGLFAEWAMFRATGGAYHIDGSHLFSAAGQVHLVLAEYGLFFAGGIVAGALITACYYRVGGWWGTITLPLTVAPAVGVWLALSTAWLGGADDDLPWAATLPAGAAVGTAVAVLVAGWAAVWAVARNIPVRSG